MLCVLCVYSECVLYRGFSLDFLLGVCFIVLTVYFPWFLCFKVHSLSFIVSILYNVHDFVSLISGSQIWHWQWRSCRKHSSLTKREGVWQHLSPLVSTAHTEKPGAARGRDDSPGRLSSRAGAAGWGDGGGGGGGGWDCTLSKQNRKQYVYGWNRFIKTLWGQNTGTTHVINIELIFKMWCHRRL